MVDVVLNDVFLVGDNFLGSYWDQKLLSCYKAKQKHHKKDYFVRNTIGKRKGTAKGTDVLGAGSKEGMLYMLCLTQVDNSGKLALVRLSICNVFRLLLPFSETAIAAQRVSFMALVLTKCFEENPAYIFETNVFSKQILLAFFSEICWYELKLGTWFTSFHAIVLISCW